jgi:hypothetical protein
MKNKRKNTSFDPKQKADKEEASLLLMMPLEDLSTLIFVWFGVWWLTTFFLAGGAGGGGRVIKWP